MLPRQGILFAALAMTLTAAWDASGQTDPGKALVELAKSRPHSSEFREAVLGRFSGEELAAGEAVAGYLGDFVWVIRSSSKPAPFIDDEPAGEMLRLKDSNLWLLTAELATGTSHAFSFKLDGKPSGRRVDVPAFGPDSYPQPGVPLGRVTEERVVTSKIYGDWTVSYWVYVPPGYDPEKGAAMMVWQDGHRFAERGKRARLFTVTENLVHQGKLPPMIHVLVAPGYIGEIVESPYVPEKVGTMRSILYDTLSDDYVRFLEEELLPEVEKEYNLREDGYSRGIAGQSSGGICALNTAWFRPDKYSRVLSRIGSFTSIQWRFGNADPAKNLDGGNVYPFLIRKQPRKNIRIWLEDGSHDLENIHGSWPLQNIQLANSLKFKEYDFHFSWGNAQHNTAHGDAELPEALTWLWRDYDPAKTAQTYEMNPAERNKPYYRVEKLNRE